MALLLIICMCIVGCFLLVAGAAFVFWHVQSHDGYRALLVLLLSFVLAYIIITSMVHIVRIYFKLPYLPWEFADVGLERLF